MYNPESPKTSSNLNESLLSESTSSLMIGKSENNNLYDYSLTLFYKELNFFEIQFQGTLSEVLDKTSSEVKTFSNKTATSQTCSKCMYLYCIINLIFQLHA